MASVNIFGGFLVTQRMLAMYKKEAEDARDAMQLASAPIFVDDPADLGIT